MARPTNDLTARSPLAGKYASEDDAVRETAFDFVDFLLQHFALQEVPRLSKNVAFF
mgnify:CR=1 FL=1